MNVHLETLFIVIEYILLIIFVKRIARKHHETSSSPFGMNASTLIDKRFKHLSLAALSQTQAFHTHFNPLSLAALSVTEAFHRPLSPTKPDATTVNYWPLCWSLSPNHHKHRLALSVLNLLSLLKKKKYSQLP